MNQYIGARYVPLIFGEWVQNQSYEPLTVVLYQGDSYTSKCAVPSGVPITNTQYWVKTGDFNAQLASFQTNLNTALNNSYNALSHDMILIGDSYAEGYTPDGNVTSWATNVSNWIKNIYPDINVYIDYQGGGGFANGVFTTLLTNRANTLSTQEKNNVRTIYVGGGYNDNGCNFSKLKNNIGNFINIAKTNFPNATVYFAPFGMCVEGLTTGAHSDTTYNDIVTGVRAWYEGAIRYGCIPCQFAYSVLRKNTLFSSDYVHPNTNGQYAISGYVMASLINGFNEWSSTYTNFSISITLDEGITGTFNILATINDNLTTIEPTHLGTTLTYQSPQSLTGGAENTHNIGTYNLAILPPTKYLYFNCVVTLNGTNGSGNYPCMLCFKNGQIYYTYIGNNTINTTTVEFNFLTQASFSTL